VLAVGPEGVGVSIALEQQVKFVRLVNVEANTREFENHKGLAGLAYSFAVRQKTIVAEAQRDEVDGPPQHAVATATIVGRNEQCTFGRSGVENRIQLSTSDKRNIARDDDGGVVSSIFAPCGRHFDGCRFALVAKVFDDTEIKFLSQCLGSGIARHKEDIDAVGDCGGGGEDVAQHRVG